jgi:hypothetical protein
MEEILKSIDQLASVLAVKLKETNNHEALDQIIKILIKCPSTPPFRSAITDTGVHRSLEEEVEKIEAMQKRGFIVRLAVNSDDAGELISSYRAIKNALDKFYVSPI